MTKAKTSPTDTRKVSPMSAQAAPVATKTPQAIAPSPAPVVALSVRLPKPMYDALLAIVFKAKTRGEKASIHGLMLDGIATVIASKRQP